MSEEVPYTGPPEPTRRKAVGQDAYDRGARRRKAMLDAIKDGLSVMDAVREAGWSTFAKPTTSGTSSCAAGSARG